MRLRILIGCLLTGIAGYVAGDRWLVALLGADTSYKLVIFSLTATVVAFFHRKATTHIEKLRETEGLESHQLNALILQLEPREKALDFRFYMVLFFATVLFVAATISRALPSSWTVWHSHSGAICYGFFGAQVYTAASLLIESARINRFSRDLKKSVDATIRKIEVRRKIQALGKSPGVCI